MGDRSRDIEKIRELKRLNDREKREKEERERRRNLVIFFGIIAVCVILILVVVINNIITKVKDKKNDEKETKTEITEEVSPATKNDAENTGNEGGQNGGNSGGAAVKTSTANDGSTVYHAANETGNTGNTTIKLTFVGDCMIASMKGKMEKGCLNWYADNYPTSYFFEKVIDYFTADDFTIANCENVFTDNDLKEKEKTYSKYVYWFKSKSKNAAILKDNSIEAVTIANNHIQDYLDEGESDTKAALDAVNLPWGKDDKVVYLEKDGFRIALVCVQFYSADEAKQTLKYLEAAKENSDYQIVYFHGGTEGVYTPDSYKKKACHDYIDNGADLVIGAHPHVLQPIEEYNGVTIVYSLGNFCFGGNKAPKNRTLIYQYELTIENGAVSASSSNMIPCYVYTGSTNNWQPTPITDDAKKQRVLDFMNGKRKDPN